MAGKRRNFYVAEETSEQLAKLAAELGLAESGVIREAVRLLARVHDKGEGAGDLAGELAELQGRVATVTVQLENALSTLAGRGATL